MAEAKASVPQLWSILLRCFFGETKIWKVSYWRKLLWLSFPPFLWWGDARFYFSSCFVFKTMDGEKENSLLANGGLSHKTVFGHELSTTDIVPKGGLCFPSISPAKGKRKKKNPKHRVEIKPEWNPYFQSPSGLVAYLSMVSLRAGFEKTTTTTTTSNNQAMGHCASRRTFQSEPGKLRPVQWWSGTVKTS